MSSRALGLLALLLLAACPDRGPKSANELLVPLAQVELGGSLAELRKQRPALEPMQAGSFLDARATDGLTVDTDGDRIVGVRLELTGKDGMVAEQRLRERLGAGSECSPLPPDIPGFRTTLWRLRDGSGVSISRMGDRLKLHFVKPVDEAFVAALSACPTPG